MSKQDCSIQALLLKCPLPKNEARILLAYLLNWSNTQLITRAHQTLETATIQLFEALVKRRLQGEPIAQIIKKREFYGLSFQIDSHVLIPRPETELLVDAGLALIKDISAPTILDLGTGSGAIAIALASQRPDAQIWAVDISQNALKIAQHNAQNLLTHPHIQWCQGHWFEALPQSIQFDLILSNPPYLSKEDPHLQQGDLRFEPRQALTDEADGLQAFRAILAQAPAYLKPNAFIWFEHGYQQAHEVCKLCEQAGLKNIASKQDLAGIERIIGGQYI